MNDADIQPCGDEPVARSEGSFSWRRVGLLFLLLIALALPRAIGEWIDIRRKQAHEEEMKQRINQEKLDREVNEQVKAVREGKVKAGEAFRRLFNIDDQPKVQAKSD